MRALFGSCGFTSNQRRNQALTRIQDEAAARGLTPYPLDFGGGVGTVSGVVTVTVEGRPGLHASYAGDDTVVQQAEDVLYRWLDGNGFVEGSFGSMTV